MKGLYVQLICPQNKKYSIIIEDNERVCYAYLLAEKEIVGDVWLYNRERAPQISEWKKEDMPFLNPQPFIDSQREIAPITKSDQVQLTWDIQDDELVEVLIQVRGELIAKMTPGSKPGWSTVVKSDGPLAKKLTANNKNERQ